MNGEGVRISKVQSCSAQGELLFFFLGRCAPSVWVVVDSEG